MLHKSMENNQTSPELDALREALQETVSQQVKQVQSLFKNLKEDIFEEIDIEVDDPKDKKRIQNELKKTENALNELEQPSATKSTEESAEIPPKTSGRLNEFVESLENKDSRFNKALAFVDDGKNKLQTLGKAYNKIAANFGLTLVPPVLLGEETVE